MRQDDEAAITAANAANNKTGNLWTSLQVHVLAL